MTTTTHTPGPWMYHAVSGRIVQTGTGLANARLITQAPAMLAWKNPVPSLHFSVCRSCAAKSLPLYTCRFCRSTVCACFAKYGTLTPKGAAVCSRCAGREVPAR
jgi:hypothetical protein